MAKSAPKKASAPAKRLRRRRRGQGTGQGGRDQGCARRRGQEGCGGQGRHAEAAGQGGRSKATPAKAAPARRRGEEGRLEGAPAKEAPTKAAPHQGRAAKAAPAKARAAKAGPRPRPRRSPPTRSTRGSSRPSASCCSRSRAKLVGEAENLEAEAASASWRISNRATCSSTTSPVKATPSWSRARATWHCPAQARQMVNDVEHHAGPHKRGQHVRTVTRVRPCHPEGAPAGHPRGRRAAELVERESRRAGTPPVTDPGQRGPSFPPKRKGHAGAGSLAVVLAVAAIVVALDQLTERWALQHARRRPGASCMSCGPSSSTSRSTRAWPSQGGEGLGPIIGVLAFVVVIVLVVPWPARGQHA